MKLFKGLILSCLAATCLAVTGFASAATGPKLLDFEKNMTLQATTPPTSNYSASGFASYQPGAKGQKGRVVFDAVVTARQVTVHNILGHANWSLDAGTFAGVQTGSTATGVVGAWVGKSNIKLANEVTAFAAVAASYATGQPIRPGLILGISIALGN